MTAADLRTRAHRTIDRWRLKADDFTIIADDCWGSGVYQHLGVPYRTPLVGTLMRTPDFVHLVENLPRLLRAPLEAWTWQTWQDQRYPAARLGGEAEVQFIHYGSFEEAQEKWARRLARVNWDRIFVKSQGDARQHPCTVSDLQRLGALPYPTVAFTVDRHPELPRTVQLQHPIANGAAQVLPSLHDVDVVRWLNTGDGRPRPLGRLVDRLVNGTQVPTHLRPQAQI